MVKRLSILNNYIFALKENFCLEDRLFLLSVIIVILFSVTSSLIAIIFSLLPELVFLSFINALLLLVIYYFVRFKKIVKPFILPVLSIYFVDIVALWLYGGGMNSQNILIAFVLFILAIIIVPKSRKIFVMFVFIMLIVIFYMIQYFRPEFISGYNSETERWIDSFTTTLYSSLFIYLLLKYVLDHYNFERRRAEEGEKKLAILNEDKDRFISILSHDLKSPFNTLLGFTQILLKNIDTYDKATIEKQLKVINDSAKYSYSLIEELLLWTKVKHGNIPFEPAFTDLKIIADDMAESFMHDLQLKEIMIDILIPDKTMVFADQNMLRIILRNLISNAIKFTHRGGAISVDVIETDLGKTIKVCDNGVGIRPQDQDKLFDGSKLHSTIGTEEERGTGLGLFLTKEFIERHKGKIWVESEPGNGSTFYFFLPDDTLKLRS
jgi:two-component system, sensor histidine kinase and response regulator